VTVADPEPASDAERLLSAKRTVVSLGAGLVAGGVLAAAWTPELLPLVTWTVATAVILAWVWWISWPRDAVGTEILAEGEMHTRSTDAWLLLAAVASLGVVAVALVRSSGRQDAVSVASVLLGVVSVMLSWALVNTVFAFKYARLYYLDEPDLEGIDFNQDGPPRYSDFAYMAFTIGMTYGVTDTEPTCTAVRRVVLGHALMSYLFGTGVLAVAVNLVTNLGSPSS
jgi:uncharacterized membrane protein